jgi:hypothetical protein
MPKLAIITFDVKSGFILPVHLVALNNTLYSSKSEYVWLTKIGQVLLLSI